MFTACFMLLLDTDMLVYTGFWVIISCFLGGEAKKTSFFRKKQNFCNVVAFLASLVLKEPILEEIYYEFRKMVVSSSFSSIN